MSKLRSELWETRTALIGMAPAAVYPVLTSYFECKTMRDILKWQSWTIDKILAAAEPKPAREMKDYGSASDRAYCPLCGESANNVIEVEGFAFPEGLRRHLEGSYNARQCVVTKAAIELAREHVADLEDPNTLKLGPIK
jgi:hypothetical protein